MFPALLSYLPARDMHDSFLRRLSVSARGLQFKKLGAMKGPPARRFAFHIY